MSTRQRWVFALCLVGTLWLHWTIAWHAPWTFVTSRGQDLFVLEAVFRNGTIVRSFAGHVAVILAAYAACLSAIAWLSRPSPRDPPRWRGRAWIVAVTWLAFFWPLLCAHARAFPNSAWGHVPDPDSGRLALVTSNALAIGWLLWRAWLSFPFEQWGRIGAVGACTALLAVPAWHWNHSSGRGAPTSDRPNVVVIGLDSLRRDLFESSSQLPVLKSIRERAFVQAGMISSLARTYPSWVSLLNSRPIASSDARENHAPGEDAIGKDSWAWRFRDIGYQTIFATDDTQFSAIGHSFGFAEIAAPESGVTNFVLSRFADLPLVNFLVQLPGSEFLLPALSANRAFVHAYRPERFVARLRNAVARESGRPLFLAMHLCALHWPFNFADPADGSRYTSAATVLDRQVGEILDMLSSIGVNDRNTLFVFLADHGDSGDDLTRSQADVVVHGLSAAPNLGSIAGHGASLLDPHQWRIFAAFMGRGASGAIEPGRSDQLASLEDLGPTIAFLAGLPDGERPVLDVATSRAADRPPLHRAVVPLETGLRIAGLDLAHPDPAVAARTASALYRTRTNGQVELTPEAYAAAIADKDLGVTNDHTMLASLHRPGQDFLVSVDLDSQRTDVYPAQRPSSDMRNPPLLLEACAGEFRKRHGTWCASAGVSEADAP